MRIVRTEGAGFTRTRGREVTAAFLAQTDMREVTAIFAHNDDMALGAVAALEAAGKAPGRDVLIVSIDGIKEVVQAIADGKINCSVECSPNTGPQLFDALDAVLKKRIATREMVIDQSQAKNLLPTRTY